MQLKKGTGIRDASGNTYTITGLDIRKQRVKHTVSLPGQEPVQGEMPVRQWKELTAIKSQYSGIVNKVPEPGKGTDAANTGLARAITGLDVTPNKPQFLISEGMLFQMMDKSLWKIWEYNRITKKLVAVNEKTGKSQDFTLDELTTLVNNGHIKILS